MRRGQTTLFDSLFKTEKPASPDKKPRQTSRRNEFLAHRYYFYAVIKKFQYQECLNELEKENFLSSETILDILSLEVRQEVARLSELAPAPNYLKSKYPWLNWSV